MSSLLCLCSAHSTTWCVQGLAWLPPWTPKPCDLVCAWCAWRLCWACRLKATVFALNSCALPGCTGTSWRTSRAVCAKAWLFQCLAMSTQALCPMLCMCVLSVKTKGCPFISLLLYTTWLNPNVLALPGFCIVVPLLSVLQHGCCKDSPDGRHEHPSLVLRSCPRGGCRYKHDHTQRFMWT